MARCCALGAYVRHACLGEGLAPGEVLGLGTVPGCCGLEIGRWLAPGAEIAVEVAGLGRVVSKVGARAPGANFKDLGRAAGQPSRLASAAKFLVLAVVGPPVVCLAMLYGFFAALLWPGPAYAHRKPKAA